MKNSLSIFIKCFAVIAVTFALSLYCWASDKTPQEDDLKSSELNKRHESIEAFTLPGWTIGSRIFSKSGHFICIVMYKKESILGDDDNNDQYKDRSITVLKKEGEDYVRVGYNNKIIMCESCYGVHGNLDISFNKKDILLIKLSAGSNASGGNNRYKFRYNSGLKRLKLIGEERKSHTLTNKGYKIWRESINHLTGDKESFIVNSEGKRQNYFREQFPKKLLYFEDVVTPFE